MKNKLKLGLPAGSLKNTTLEIFKKAGFNIFIDQRSYFPIIDDEEIECFLFRAQEIPKYVEKGILDIGLTGKDLIIETKVKIIEVAELLYSKRGLGSVEFVLAVPNDSKIKSIKDLEGKRIATELVNVTKDYLKKNKVKANVEFSWGATEIKPPKIVDAITELTETGQSLRANNLKIIDTIMESTTRIIANKKSWQDKWKKQKINNIVILLKGVLAAEEKVGLKMNIKKDNLKKVLKILSSLESPTISDLNKKEWVAIEIIMDEKKVRNIIPQLKEAGATGIIEYPLNKVIY